MNAMLLLTTSSTEKTPGMFATIIIILPSKFTGGSLRLSHAKNKALVDASTHSSFATHVTAWYTDVYHSVNKVQSGYRLALSYNLVHTSAPSLKPTLTYLSVEAQELRHILLSWKQKEYPDKLLYLLEHEYSEYNLQASSLKGEDAARVAYLRAVAEPLRFRLCLVTVELHESGQGDDDGGYNYCDPYAEASDEDSDEDSDSDSNLDKGKKHPTISLVEESEFTINDAFDLDGNDVELKKDLDLDDDDCIPYPLSTTEPDEEEYGGYTGNVSVPSRIPSNADNVHRRAALWNCVREKPSCLLVSTDNCDQGIVALHYSSGRLVVIQKLFSGTMLNTLRRIWRESHPNGQQGLNVKL